MSLTSQPALLETQLMPAVFALLGGYNMVIELVMVMGSWFMSWCLMNGLVLGGK